MSLCCCCCCSFCFHPARRPSFSFWCAEGASWLVFLDRWQGEAGLSGAFRERPGTLVCSLSLLASLHRANNPPAMCGAKFGKPYPLSVSMATVSQRTYTNRNGRGVAVVTSSPKETISNRMVQVITRHAYSVSTFALHGWLGKLALLTPSQVLRLRSNHRQMTALFCKMLLSNFEHYFEHKSFPTTHY